MHTTGFFHCYSTPSGRQILAESTWSCVYDDKLLEVTDDGNASAMIMKKMTGVEKLPPPTADPSLVMRRTVSIPDTPSIYNSPRINCFFTIGSQRVTAAFDAEKSGMMWCGPDSGMDPWKNHHRLAASPFKCRQHYRRYRFSKFRNVGPDGKCMASLSGGIVCSECDQFESGKYQYSPCTRPRTWCIGACIYLMSPYVRHPGYEENPRDHVVPTLITKVVPLAALETKSE